MPAAPSPPTLKQLCTDQFISYALQHLAKYNADTKASAREHRMYVQRVRRLPKRAANATLNHLVKIFARGSNSLWATMKPYVARGDIENLCIDSPNGACPLNRAELESALGLCQELLAIDLPKARCLDDGLLDAVAARAGELERLSVPVCAGITRPAIMRLLARTAPSGDAKAAAFGQRRLQHFNISGCSKVLKLKAGRDDLLRALPSSISELGISGARRLSVASQTLLFGRLSTLESLDMSCCAMTAVSPALVQLTRLRRLDLSRNRIETVAGEAIAPLVCLEHLDLSANRLVRLPREIGRLVRIQTILLRVNHLGTLPNEMGGLKSLKRLDVSFNRLLGLPETLAGIRGLRDVQCTYNPMKGIPLWLLRVRVAQRRAEEVGGLGDCKVDAGPNRNLSVEERLNDEWT